MGVKEHRVLFGWRTDFSKKEFLLEQKFTTRGNTSFEIISKYIEVMQLFTSMQVYRQVYLEQEISQEEFKKIVKDKMNYLVSFTSDFGTLVDKYKGEEDSNSDNNKDISDILSIIKITFKMLSDVIK